MPSMRMFGRRWLVGTDDFVFPGLLELFARAMWLVTTCVVLSRYDVHRLLQFDRHRGVTDDDFLMGIYLVGVAATNFAAILLAAILVNRSAQGTVFDTRARRAVPRLIAAKIVLLAPEIALNVLGTTISLRDSDVLLQRVDGGHHFTGTAVKIGVTCNWIVLGACALVAWAALDPVGSLRRPDGKTSSSLSNSKHVVTTRSWTARFRWLFCCLTGDKNSQEAFRQVAKLISHMFGDRDVVLSDIVAGFVLLGAKHSSETMEEGLHRIRTSDISECFGDKPDWMCLKKARRYLELAAASYSWPYLLYRYYLTGLFRMISKLFCCSCVRTKPTTVKGDNCCLCNLAAVRYMSKLSSKDVLYASFVNRIFESPFFVAADRETESIVVVIRGSLSVQDAFTDLAADAKEFDADGAPAGSYAQKGMLSCAKYVKKELDEHNVIENALASFPEYKVVVTGHSLGAAVAVLLGFYMRSSYPDVKVYAFSTPAPLLSREAARKAEEFAFSVCLGDDLFTRFTVEYVEQLRDDVVEELQSCGLPKYRIFLNGLSCVLFGRSSRRPEESVTTRHRTSSESRDSAPRSIAQYSPVTTAQNDGVSIDIELADRAHPKVRLYIPGHILHITEKSKALRKADKKSGIISKKYRYEMRWALPEDFNRIIVTPRMVLDHLPENVTKPLIHFAR